MLEKSANIYLSNARDRIRVRIDNKFYLEGPIGTTIGDFLHAAQYDDTIIASICNQELRELNYELNADSVLSPVFLSSSDGGRIYRRSLVMLMTTAAAELWKNCHIDVRYAVPDGGFYCTRVDAEPFTDDELAQLYAHMRKLIAANAPITKRTVSIDEAINVFDRRGEHGKVRLLKHSTRSNLVLYTLRNRDDYFYGYMVPSTGFISHFKLINLGDGFILQYPRKEQPDTLSPLTNYAKLRQVFNQTDDWLRKMRVEDIGRLNSIIEHDHHIHELILVAEALHEQNIATIAGQIAEQREKRDVRLILIAGPSSSGKTTFSKRLAIQLLAHGLRPFTLELDNYFVDRELTPRDENGDYNFESLKAINLDLFNAQLLALFKGERIQIPHFDFLTGKSQPGRYAELKDDQIIIIEGIHGLNPKLVPNIPQEMLFRVYVSALTQLNIDGHNRIPTTDVRLLRRIVRDAQHRGYTATDTLERWQSVRRGEKDNIFPYQENADAMFNSALVYELAALRPMVEPLLLQVKYGTQSHIEAKRLLSFLSWVKPLPHEHLTHIPDTSLLREFIGDSNLTHYVPGNLGIEDEI